MNRILVGAVSVAVVFSLSPGLSSAQSSCPAEVAQAKEMLSKSRKTASVKPEDVQAPRAMAGARQDTAAPRENQSVQAPRGNQDVQAPRGNQNVQSPRGNQSVQAPRENEGAQAPRGNQNVQAPRENEGAQAPRGNQNVQAPRENEGAQAPRGNQDVQAPRGNQNVQAPRTAAGATTPARATQADLKKAGSLVKEAESACKAGNTTLAADKAKAAMALLK